VSTVEDFLAEVDGLWAPGDATRVRLRLIGSTALMLATGYERGTKDSDIFETIDLTRETKQRLLAIAGPGTEVHRRRRMYLEIVANGVPFLPWPARWQAAAELNQRLRHLEIAVLDVVDVVVSKLKRLNDNDLTDIAAMIDLDLVRHDALVARFRSAVDVFSGDARAADLPRYVANLHRVERDMLGVAESDIELPGWI